MTDPKKNTDVEQPVAGSASDKESQKESKLHWSFRGLIIDPETGDTIWPRYGFPQDREEIDALIQSRQEAIEYSLQNIPSNIRTGIVQSVNNALKSQYYENLAWGNKSGTADSEEFLRNAISAAYKILRKMMKDFEKGYDYGQGDMLRVIHDNILEFESVLEARRKQKYSSDISAQVRSVVTHLASLKGKGIANNDEIGRLLLATGLFNRVRCNFDDHTKLKPQISKNGLKIEIIPYDEWPQDLKSRNTKCRFLELVPNHPPACIYPRKDYCKKATDKVQRIIAGK